MVVRFRAIAAAALLGIAGCASDPPPAPGATAASLALQGDIRRIINILEMTSEPRCDAFTIVDTELAGLGRELWIVERCGERVPYLVTFIVRGTGATNLSVRREE
jgi:hypothetical protein